MDYDSAESLPIWVQFVGLGLAAFSAFGVLLAIPTLLQVFLGGPKLNARFGTYDPGDGSRLLLVYLENRPAAKWLQKLAVVKRDTIQSLTVAFQIVHLETKVAVVPVHQAKIKTDADPTDKGRYRITLPPTYSIAASFTVAQWTPSSGGAEIPPTLGKAAVPLARGPHTAEIILTVDGEPDVQLRRFSVGPSSANLNWLSDGTATWIEARLGTYAGGG